MLSMCFSWFQSRRFDVCYLKSTKYWKVKLTFWGLTRRRFKVFSLSYFFSLYLKFSANLFLCFKSHDIFIPSVPWRLLLWSHVRVGHMCRIHVSYFLEFMVVSLPYPGHYIRITCFKHNFQIYFSIQIIFNFWVLLKV